jgi:hypothetical protein
MNPVVGNSPIKRKKEKSRALSRFVFALILTLNSCSPSDALPEKQQAKEVVEGRLWRIGNPIKTFGVEDSHLLEHSGATFYCINWYGDLAWNYPRGTKRKLYGYVKFIKTKEGWKADHINYSETPHSADQSVKCE